MYMHTYVETYTNISTKGPIILVTKQLTGIAFWSLPVCLWMVIHWLSPNSQSEVRPIRSHQQGVDDRHQGVALLRLDVRMRGNI